MTINGRLLNWGVFFIAIGAVVLAAQATAIGSAEVLEALRYWPVLVIALGVGLILRRTRLNVAGGMLAAAAPGLLFGGLIVAAPDMPGDCRDIRPVALTTQQGTFDGAAVVDLELSCGEVTVTTAPGYDWEARTGNGRGRGPVVTADGGRLAIESVTDRRPFSFARGGDEWQLTLPTAVRLDLDAVVSAGRATFDLDGAQLDSARFVVNAGDARLDLGDATVPDVSVRVNAAKATLSLPATGDLVLDASVNAGALEICVPDGLAVRVHETSTLAGFDHTGLVRADGAWQSPDYATAIHHADVSVTANVGSVDINPEGGCK